MTTDVADRTEVQADTETVQASETEAPRGTDTNLEAQTETGSEQNGAEGSSPPSGRAARLSALADAERMEERQKGREEALSELQQTGTKQQQEAARQKLKNAYPTTIRTVEDILNGVINEGRALTTIEVAEVKRHFNNYNLTAWDGAAAEAADIVKTTVYGMMSKDAQDEFTKATAEDTPLPDYLNLAFEKAAPNSKYVKSLDLESALKVSAKLRKEIEADRLDQYNKGWDEGLNAPPGTSPDGGRGAGRTAPGNKTYAQLEEGYGNGTLPAAEEKLYLQMRADKARQR